jgi:ADP-ribose pyrophosphatase YjhB (NUDIX family)
MVNKDNNESDDKNKGCDLKKKSVESNYDFLNILFNNDTNVKPLPHKDSRSQRNPIYPKRLFVPDSKVLWSESFPDYEKNIQNFQFISNAVKENQILSLDSDLRWSDNDDPSSIDWSKRITIFNGYDQAVKDVINFDVNGYPLNPSGRTGLMKNGLLGKIGPNHAADPVVIKKIENDYYFISIERKDKTGWALPGGMIDKYNPTISSTLKNELYQEALNNEKSEELIQTLDNILKNEGHIIYKGYVDDCRNTDTSWLETTAVMFDVSNYPEICNMSLSAGDDAINVTWLKVDDSDIRFKNFYADHKDFVYMSVNEIEKKNKIINLNQKDTISNIYEYNNKYKISLYVGLLMGIGGLLFYNTFRNR